MSEVFNKLKFTAPHTAYALRELEIQLDAKLFQKSGCNLILTDNGRMVFFDEQISGPYSFWHNTQRFESRDGGARLYDEVRYFLPMALIAPVRDPVDVLYVRPSLERIFDYREQVCTRLFGGIPEISGQASRAMAAREENPA